MVMTAVMVCLNARANAPQAPLANAFIGSPMITDADRAQAKTVDLNDVLVIVTQQFGHLRGPSYSSFWTFYRAMIAGQPNLDYTGANFFQKIMAETLNIRPWILAQYPALAKYQQGYTPAQFSDIIAELGTSQIVLLPVAVQQTFERAEIMIQQHKMNEAVANHAAAVEARIQKLEAVAKAIRAGIPSDGFLGNRNVEQSGRLLAQGELALQEADSSGECFDVNQPEIDFGKFEYDLFSEMTARYVRTYDQLLAVVGPLRAWLETPHGDLAALGANFSRLKAATAPPPEEPTSVPIPKDPSFPAGCDPSMLESFLRQSNLQGPQTQAGDGGGGFIRRGSRVKIQ
jgi:hypothetical protein